MWDRFTNSYQEGGSIDGLKKGIKEEKGGKNCSEEKTGKESHSRVRPEADEKSGEESREKTDAKNGAAGIQKDSGKAGACVVGSQKTP